MFEKISFLVKVWIEGSENAMEAATWQYFPIYDSLLL